MASLRSTFHAQNPRSSTRHHARFPCHGSTASCSAGAAGPAARSGTSAARSGTSAACSADKDRTGDTERSADEEEANCSCDTPTKETCRTRHPRGHLQHRQWLARISHPRPSGVLLHGSRLLLSLRGKRLLAPRGPVSPDRDVTPSTPRVSAASGWNPIIATYESGISLNTPPRLRGMRSNPSQPRTQGQRPIGSRGYEPAGIVRSFCADARVGVDKLTARKPCCRSPCAHRIHFARFSHGLPEDAVGLRTVLGFPTPS
jgi:hypothetical protein